MYGKKSGGQGGDAGGLFCHSLPQPRRRQLPHPAASLWSLTLRAPLQRQTGAALWVPFLICPLGPGWLSLWFGKNARGFSLFAEWQDDEREQWIEEAGCREKACGGMEVSCKVGWALCLHGQKMGMCGAQQHQQHHMSKCSGGGWEGVCRPQHRGRRMLETAPPTGRSGRKVSLVLRVEAGWESRGPASKGTKPDKLRVT